MFVLRSLFWLAALIMLLPAPADGEPPRLAVLKAISAAVALDPDPSMPGRINRASRGTLTAADLTPPWNLTAAAAN